MVLGAVVGDAMGDSPKEGATLTVPDEPDPMGPANWAGMGPGPLGPKEGIPGCGFGRILLIHGLTFEPVQKNETQTQTEITEPLRH